MATLHSGGVDLYFDRVGDGPLTVLTHGSWGDGNAWSGVVPKLAEHYEVITWDRRGHSRSDDGPGGMRQDAVDLCRLIEHIGGTAHLVGASFGSIVALKALEMRPKLVNKVVVHEPPLLSLLSGQDQWVDELAKIRRQNEIVVEIIGQKRYEDAAEYFVDNVGVGPGAWERLPQPVRDGFSANATTYLGDAPDAFETRAIDWATISDLETPIRLTKGTASPSYNIAVVDQLARKLPGAEVEVIEGAGHIAYRSHPELWSEGVLEFLGRS